jgi:hypothetical protein
MSKQEDIEIYIKGSDIAAIGQWLTGVFSRVRLDDNGNKVIRGELALDENSGHCDLLVINNAVKGYTSVWFKQNHTPWDTDLDCARSAWQAMQQEIRASAGSWIEGAEPDLFHCLNATGESRLVWRSS